MNGTGRWISTIGIRRSCAARSRYAIGVARSVSGWPLKGMVWDDDRVDLKGIRPLVDEHGRPVTFAGWYLSWLGEATAEASASRHKRG